MTDRWALFGLLILIFSTVPVSAAPTRISDPVSFVAEVYQHFLKAQSTGGSYTPPQDIFTARLSKLVRDDLTRSKGEVGCLDFEFWVNGQDWKIANLKVAIGTAGKDRQTVIAKFLNLGVPEEIHFEFRRIGAAGKDEGRWLLDDAHSLKDPRWTLSDILKCAF
jgi:hypothetical protein